MFSDEISYCIVLLTSKFVHALPNKRYTGLLLNAAASKNKFILPVRLAKNLPELPPYIDIKKALDASPEDFQLIIDTFVSKAQATDTALFDLHEYSDIQTVIKQYSGRSDPQSIGHICDKSKHVGFDLFLVTDEIAEEHNKYFLYLYEGAALQHTAQNFADYHPDLTSKSGLVVILPKEPGQKMLEKRKENVARIFSTKNVYYIDEFIWKYCTRGEFLNTNITFNRKNYVDPPLVGTSTTALQYLADWWKKRHNPVLIVKGGGGIGKTELVKFFHDRAIEEPNVRVVYIEAVDYGSINLPLTSSGRCAGLYPFFRTIIEERRTDGHITEDLFRISLDNGTLAIIIDGLDEAIAHNSEHFDIESFFDSIYRSTAGMGHGKVIITCRNHFWDQSNPSFCFECIELAPFDRSRAGEFFSARLPGMLKLVDKSLALADKLTRGTNNSYIPYALDLILRLVKDEAQDEGVFSAEFHSQYLVQTITNDYILYKFCHREITKLPTLTRADDQVWLLVHMAANKHSVIDEKHFEEFCLHILGGDTDTVTLNALKAHPLLRSDNGVISFAYDFFEEHFLNIYIGIVINELAPVTEQTLNVIAQYNRVGSIFLRDLVSRLDQLTDEKLLLLLSLLEKVRYITKISQNLDRQRSHVIAGVFNIALQFIIDRESGKSERFTELMLTFFGENKGTIVRDMHIRGITQNNSPKIIFDFSQLLVVTSRFEDYDFFWQCQCDQQTKFEQCEFVGLRNLEQFRPEFRGRNFDFQSCKLDEQALRILRDTRQRHTDEEQELISWLQNCFRAFSKHGNYGVPRKEASLKSVFPDGKIPFAKFMRLAIRDGLVEEVPKKQFKTYLLAPRHQEEIEKFVTQAIIPPTIRGLYERCKE